MATSYSIFAGSCFIEDYDVKHNETDFFFDDIKKVNAILSPRAQSFFHVFSEYELEDFNVELLTPDESIVFEITTTLKTFFS